MEDLNVPAAVRPYADQIVAVTDAVCLEHLNEEFAELCRKLVGQLGRMEPSPLLRGDLAIWSAGIVYAIGQVNFLFNRAQTPHATTAQLSEWLGVNGAVMKSRAQRLRAKVSADEFEKEFQTREMQAINPLTWLLEVDGSMVDIRRAPLSLQVRALELGLIPYIPGPAKSRP